MHGLPKTEVTRYIHAKQSPYFCCYKPSIISTKGSLLIRLSLSYQMPILPGQIQFVHIRHSSLETKIMQQWGRHMTIMMGQEAKSHVQNDKTFHLAMYYIFARSYLSGSMIATSTCDPIRTTTKLLYDM